jgi:hypothetical protein
MSDWTVLTEEALAIERIGLEAGPLSQWLYSVEWVSENMVKPVAGAPEGDDSEARLRAEECLIAAKEQGIAKQDLEEEVGDLVDYMSAAIEKAVNADVDRAAMKDRS